MKKLLLNRVSNSELCTMGVILDENTGIPLMVCLENPDKNNEPFISRIPQGIYVCHPFSGEKYKNVFQVMNVPGRTFILFHAGNTEDDTKGCILPGKSFGILNAKPAVLNSNAALKELKEFVGNSSFQLNIINSGNIR